MRDMGVVARKLEIRVVDDREDRHVGHVEAAARVEGVRAQFGQRQVRSVDRDMRHCIEHARLRGQWLGLVARATCQAGQQGCSDQ